MTARRPHRSFVLLEVTLAMMILSIVMMVVLRGFMTAMAGIRDMRVIETASLLAESLMEDYELEPPVDRAEGSFGDDPRFGEAFAEYRWERDIDEIAVDYDRIPRDPLQEQEPLYELSLRVYHDDGRDDQLVIELQTFLLDTQLFTDTALQSNQLF